MINRLAAKNQEPAPVRKVAADSGAKRGFVSAAGRAKPATTKTYELASPYPTYLVIALLPSFVMSLFTSSSFTLTGRAARIWAIHSFSRCVW